MENLFKLRIWDNEDKKYVPIMCDTEETKYNKGQAILRYSSESGIYATLSGYRDEDGWPYQMDCIIEQSIGVLATKSYRGKDKNDKLIYVGDICKWHTDFNLQMKNTYAREFFEKFKLKEFLFVILPYPNGIHGFMVKNWFIKQDGSRLTEGEFQIEYSKDEAWRSEFAKLDFENWPKELKEHSYQDTTDGFRWTQMYGRKLDVGGLQIIGNVHENPELLNT